MSIKRLILIQFLLFLLVGCSKAKFVSVGESEAPSTATALNVAHSVRTIQPSLAVRGVGCITCHASVNSNLVTDFGYGGDSKGRDYFFGTIPASSSSSILWNHGAMYGDHGKSLSTLELSEGKKIVTLDKEVPQIVADAEGVSTISDYIRKLLPQTEIQTASSIYIGAPTESRLMQVFGISEGRRYLKSNAAAYELTGIIQAGRESYYTNSGEVTCDGDLFIVGTLHLDNLQLRTQSGCRIYVTGSIFVSGPVVYLANADGKNDKSNLQLVSSRSINLGMGLTKKDGAFCEPNGWYGSQNLESSLRIRYRDIWTVATHFTRNEDNPYTAGEKVLADAGKVEKTLYDATCESNGRMVGFERILLNAPQVHSRYTGPFKGTIIAEVSVISLASFKFEFDPVFMEVDVLPVLNESEFFQLGF